MSKIRNVLLSSTSVDAGAIFLYQLISVGVLFSSHNGTSVLACAYQLKVRSKKLKNFEYWFCLRLCVEFTMFLLNSTSVDAGAIFL
ncbi:hypothetical protein, partial [Haemophilus influenzae]|uniref:hypothetical protein n=1 Tax=Haemophilus influenzae TaxID=727 RepID=UPI0019530308